MAYLLDANVFITAKNLHYGMDFCPGFWDWIIDGHRKGSLYSIEMVAEELRGAEDELTEWIEALDDGFFLPVGQADLPSLGVVATWANEQPQYTQGAKNDFLNLADYYLVAQALAGGHVVVTHEIPKDAKKRIPIPNACVGVGARYMLPFTMLRREKARFVMDGRQGKAP